MADKHRAAVGNHLLEGRAGWGFPFGIFDNLLILRALNDDISFQVFVGYVRRLCKKHY